MGNKGARKTGKMKKKTWFKKKRTNAYLVITSSASNEKYSASPSESSLLSSSSTVVPNDEPTASCRTHKEPIIQHLTDGKFFDVGAGGSQMLGECGCVMCDGPHSQTDHMEASHGESITDNDSLQMHTQTHTGKKPFECSSAGCPENFNTLQELTDHQEAHNRPFHCHFAPCTASYVSEDLLKTHEHLHTVKDYKCSHDGCSASFTKAMQFRLHQIIHIGKWYKCKFSSCAESFVSLHHLTKHMELHSKPTSDYLNKRYACLHEGCEAVFDKHKLFNEHRKIHWDKAKIVLCEYEGCSAAFVSRPSLVAHWRDKHEPDVRLYKCAYAGCTASFHTPYGLQVHVRRHEMKNPPDYPDLVQDKSTTAESAKDQPPTKIHVNKKQRLYRCKIKGCNKTFRNPIRHDLHKKTHSGERPPYECFISSCTSAFPTLSQLSQHKQEHAKKFKCKSCGVGFWQRNSLNAHRRKTNCRSARTDINQCNKEYKCPEDGRYHMISKHQSDHHPTYDTQSVKTEMIIDDFKAELLCNGDDVKTEADADCIGCFNRAVSSVDESGGSTGNSLQEKWLELLGNSSSKPGDTVSTLDSRRVKTEMLCNSDEYIGVDIIYYKD